MVKGDIGTEASSGRENDSVDGDLILLRLCFQFIG